MPTDDEWIAAALRLAQEVAREIEANGATLDIGWVRDRHQDIVWHLRGAQGDPGPHPPSIPWED